MYVHGKPSIISYLPFPGPTRLQLMPSCLSVALSSARGDKLIFKPDIWVETEVSCI